MSDRILVPVDGSEHSRNALSFATTTFDDATFVILHAIDPYDVASVTEKAVWDTEFVEQRKREAEDLLEEYADLAEEHGVSIETNIAHGVPSRAILGAVDDLDIDHVVIGSRGRSGIGRVLLGSVAETVARRAPVSVTIVRPDR